MGSALSDPRKINNLQGNAFIYADEPETWVCEYGDNIAEFRGPDARLSCMKFLRDTFTVFGVIPPRYRAAPSNNGER